MGKKQTKDQPDEKIRFRDLMADEMSTGQDDSPDDKAREADNTAEADELLDTNLEDSSEKIWFTELREVDQRVNPETLTKEQKKKDCPADGITSEAESIKALYDEVYKEVSLIYEDAANSQKINIEPLLPLVEILSQAMAQPEPEEEIASETLPEPTFYREVMVATTASLDWPAHSIHVATLAVKIGAGAGYKNEVLASLAIAGLVHDVGMMRMPLTILENPEPLSSEERAVIQTHPIEGAEIIGQLGPDYEWLQAVVLQEHEQHRGQGYPHGISGREIDEFARIIGMVDAFVAMTQPRPWRPPMTPHEAAKELIYIRKDNFDPKFVKLFLKKVTIFPINSIVRLSNNEIGQILSVHEDLPLRPTIEVLQPNRGKKVIEHKILDLRKRPLLYITGSVSEKELAELAQ